MCFERGLRRRAVPHDPRTDISPSIPAHVYVRRISIGIVDAGDVWLSSWSSHEFVLVDAETGPAGDLERVDDFTGRIVFLYKVRAAV